MEIILTILSIIFVGTLVTLPLAFLFRPGPYPKNNQPFRGGKVKW